MSVSLMAKIHCLKIEINPQIRFQIKASNKIYTLALILLHFGLGKTQRDLASRVRRH